MQSLNKKLDNERALQKLQREDSRSRSKSPLQPARDMPRQMPQRPGGSYTGGTLQAARRSLSKGRGGQPQNAPSVGNKQPVAPRRGLKADSHAIQPNPKRPTPRTTAAQQSRKLSACTSSNSSRGPSSGRSTSSDYEERPDAEAQLLYTTGAGRDHRRDDDRREFSPDSYGDSEDEDEYYDEEADDAVRQGQSFYQPAGHLRRAVNVQHQRPGPNPKKPVAVAKGRTSQVYAYEKRTKSAKRDMSANHGGEPGKRRSSRQQSKSGTRVPQKNPSQGGSKAIISAAAGVERKHAQTGRARDRDQHRGVNFFNSNTTMREAEHPNSSLIQGGRTAYAPGAGSAAGNRTMQSI